MTQPMTDSKKLAAIRALRADVNPDGSAWLDAADVAEVLDAPSVPAARAGGIDRDALRTEVVEILHEVARDAVDRYEVPMSYPPIDFNARADAVLALVQPAPPALDLGVVRRILTDALPADPKWVGWVDGRIEEIAASGPSAGVVLTPDEAADLAVAASVAAEHLTGDGWAQRFRVLAARLEEASS